ncbi:tyrosine-type recombinase/integrase (plasmid) [Streptomyces virginiae]|uniref:tyrosine-type recombinase/integrase n=1 Tax=Streptomyces virginiae TaxID=1961 RepID=UPI002F916D00
MEIEKSLSVITDTARAALARGEAGAGLSARAEADVQAGIPESTRRAYNSDFAGFARWSLEGGRRPLPADATTVTEYVSHLKHTPREKTGKPYGPSSLDRVIAAIRTVHRAADLPVPETKGARKVVAGYRAELSEAKDDETRKRARPNRVEAAVPAVLRRMLEDLDRTTLRGLRDAALLLLGYALAARGSELVSLNADSVQRDPEGKGLVVSVYRKKTKRWTDTKVVYGSNPDTCPVRATEALLAALARNGRGNGPLFLRIDRHGRVAAQSQRRNAQGVLVTIGSADGRLSAEGASDIIAAVAEVSGEDGRWRSHSLRRGFVTAAHAAGKDIVHIGRHGGWADGSKALLAYIEEDDGWKNNPLIGIGL